MCKVDVVGMKTLEQQNLVEPFITRKQTQF